MFKQTILLITLIFVISGCGGSEPVPAQSKTTKKELPSWYISPPKDNSTDIYGVAMAKNRDSAIKLALTDMISKLGIKIESSYESTEQLKYSYASKSVKQQITASTAAIKINNYNVVEAERMSYNQFVVLLKTDKLKLARSLEESVDRKHKKLQTELMALQDSNILTRYNRTKAIVNDASTLLSDVLIIKELDPSFSDQEVQAFLVKLNSDYSDVNRDLNFVITGDKNSLEFVNALKNHFTQNGYQLSKKINKDSIHLKISTAVNHTNTSSVKISVFTIRTEALNNKEQIGGNRKIIKLRFNGNRQTLYKNASIQYIKELQDKDINAFLEIKQ